MAAKQPDEKKTDKDIAEDDGPTPELPNPEHELNPDVYRAPEAD